MDKLDHAANPPPNIWIYSDYRKYLNACVSSKKGENSKFSYSFFAKSLGTTKPYLKLVTSRKRNISIDKVLKVSNLFGHSLFERQYFIFLYLENVSKDDEIKKFFRSILKAYTPGGKPRNPVVEYEAEEKYSALRDWLTLSICGLSVCANYQHDANWIQNELGGAAIVSKKRVQEALQQLEKSGVLSQDSKGKWNINIKSEIRSARTYDFDQHQNYKTGLVRCLMAIDLLGKTDIHYPNRFFTNIIAVNKDDQKKVFSLIEKFEKDLFEITKESTNPTQVMLLSNNLITLNRASTMSK